MTCPTCIPMCATTEKHLKIRLDNMAHAKGVEVSPCRACGGTDWATTREMVQPEPEKKRWKLPVPPLSAIRWLHLAGAVWCLFFAAISQEKWQVFANAFFGGFNLVGMLYVSMQLKLRDGYDEMKVLLDDVMAMNHALLRGEVQSHIMGMVKLDVDDDDKPISPKLH